MPDVVNLRTVRKQRRRAEARAHATEAAARSGEGAADVRLRRAEEALDRRRHDGHSIAPKDGESDAP